MLAANRHRLNLAAKRGSHGAKLALSLISQTEDLLGVILLGSNLLNATSAGLATVISFQLADNDKLALAISTVLVTIAILIFSEATPKILAAKHANQTAVMFSLPLKIILILLSPAVWMVNQTVRAILRLLRVTLPADEEDTMTSDEFRMLALDSARFVSKKHHSILMNLFELQQVTVDDIMIPRRNIEALNLSMAPEQLAHQIATCHHTRMPVYEGVSDDIIGIVHVRTVLHQAMHGIEADMLRNIMREPYFVPTGTQLFTQLQQFQECKQRLGLIVDEYGELLGLITLEDILEQMIGEFTTIPPNIDTTFDRHDGTGIIVDGSALLRDLNRKLETHFPLTGPNTLNGLIVEYFRAIPEAGTCLALGGQRLEILQTQGRTVKTVKIYFPYKAS